MTTVIFGVAGAGKTTVGRMLAEDLGWGFYDADDYHPPANIDKMSAGLPLTDTDRFPWLQSLCTLMENCEKKGENIVLACSALKQNYRDRLAVSPDIRFVLLKVDAETAERRLTGRQGHFMPAGLIASQFADLEEAGSNLIVVDGDLPPAKIVDEIKRLILGNS